MVRRTFVGVMACCAWVGLASAVAAQEAAERPFTWTPSIQIRGLVTDNINLTKHNRDGDSGVFAAPRLEAAYRTEAYELDFDGSVDVRRYTKDSKVDETFYRVHTGAEVGILPGLSVLLKNDYTPHLRDLGLPDDDPANLIQTNRAELEMRYWRELEGARELAVGVIGGRFDTERFSALVPGPGGVPVQDNGFRADFWETGGYAEFQNPFGENHAGYVWAGVKHRSFDEESDADHLDASALLGFRTHIEPGLEFDIAGGWGYLDFNSGDDKSRALVRADLKLRRPNGWRFDLGFHNELTVDITGKDFMDTTGRVGIEKYLGTRTAVGVTGFLSRLENHATSPKDNLFGGVEVKVRRQLARKLTASLSYRYWRNTGAYTSDDMRQNRAMLSLTYRH